MRLINTTTLKLEDFVDDRAQNYAILSHRWETEEVSYQDMAGRADIADMAGYRKISRCCAQARADKLSYVWVDTCCIDKSSSAELQEAINSMYRWYKDADTCYAYLSDVTADDDANNLHQSLEKSQWFKRGWTLQELIAPSQLTFYDKDWTEIGSRAELAEVMSTWTNIPSAVLMKTETDLTKFLIAERMSWAKGRKTTRTEDRAYSLLGIFDVNMPLLYGEGTRAFTRLQEEIIRKSSDQYIFAWTDDILYSQILAPSPDCFELRESLSTTEASLDFERRGHQTLTNEGLNLELEMTPSEIPHTYLALFNYGRLSRSREGIFLRRVNDEHYYIPTLDPSYGRIFSEKAGPRRGVSETRVSIDLRARYRPFKKLRISLVHNTIGIAEEQRLRIRCSSTFYAPRFGDLGTHSCTESKPVLSPRGFGPVDVVDGPGGTFSKAIDKVILGFDFDHCPTIVIDGPQISDLTTGKDLGNSVSKMNSSFDWKRRTDTDAWLTISNKPHSEKIANTHGQRKWRSLWLLKLEYGSFSGYKYRVTLYLGEIEGEGHYSLRFELSRQNEDEPWMVHFHVPFITKVLPSSGFQCLSFPIRNT